MADELTARNPTTPSRGAVLAVSMRWADRALGLLSTILLARLLVPEDFGLVAMAMVIVGLVDGILDLGVASALIQRDGLDSEEFSTAWTLRLLQALAAAVLLVVVAPFVAQFFGDPRVTNVVRVIALTVVLGSLENIGVVSFQKNMEFGRDFRLFAVKRIIGLLLTVSVALILRSYWALVLGSLFSRLAGVAVSYWVSSFRPRLTLSRFAAIWSFSQWKVIGGVAAYLYHAADKAIIGRVSDASTVGAYTIGKEMASLPTSELLAPLGRVMFPAFSAAKNDNVELLRIWRLALGVQALIGVPAGIGVALVAPEAIPLVLGEKWDVAVPFTQLLAISAIATSLEHSSGYLLLAVGRIRQQSIIYWLRLVIFVLAVLMFLREFGADGVVIARVVTSFGSLLVMLWISRQALSGMSLSTIVEAVWRPLASSAVMAVCVWVVEAALPDTAEWFLLLAKVATGVGTYAIALMALWWIARRPTGAETYLMAKMPLFGSLLK